MELQVSKIDNIKSLWKEIGNKTQFIKDVAVEVDRSPNTLHHHWFARFWNVPEEHQDKVIELLQNQIAIQNTQ